jgi:hypothetical protein
MSTQSIKTRLTKLETTIGADGMTYADMLDWLDLPHEERLRRARARGYLEPDGSIRKSPALQRIERAISQLPTDELQQRLERLQARHEHSNAT